MKTLKESTKGNLGKIEQLLIFAIMNMIEKRFSDDIEKVYDSAQ